MDATAPADLLPDDDDRPRRRPVLRIALMLPVPLIAVAAAWFIWGRPAPVTYDTAPVARRDLENAVTASGRIQPYSFVDVGAQVSGQLRQLHVAPGDVVRAGQVLASIDAEVQAAQVEGLQAELSRLAAQKAEIGAQLAFAERQAGRQNSLLGRSASQSTLEQAERDRDVLRAQSDAVDATMRRSQAELRAEQATLDRSRITSPMAGTVVAIEAREGQMLNANYDTPIILRIADLSVMTVQSDVSEADVVHLQKGMPVWFSTLGFPDRKYRATLRQILPAPPIPKDGEETSTIVNYRALFDIQNPEGALLSGMTAQVFFVTEAASDVLSVPIAALDDDGSLRVMVEGIPERRRPETGMRTRAFVEIRSGLAEGESVITAERRDDAPSALRIVP